MEFYEYDRNSPSVDNNNNNNTNNNHNKRERFDVKVVTEGTHDDALHRGARLGQTIVTLLPPGEEGVRIPRGLDIPKFWIVLEECVQRADLANEARQASLGASGGSV